MRQNTWKACMTSALFCFGLVFFGMPARADEAAIVKLPSEIIYSEATPGKPQTAVLYGDPTKPGLYVMRLKFPAGFKVAPHTHPEEIRLLTVISGTLYFGRGEKFDEEKVAPYPAGTFFSEYSGLPHFVWAKDGEVVVQITGIGPSGFIPARHSQD